MTGVPVDIVIVVVVVVELVVELVVAAVAVVVDKYYMIENKVSQNVVGFE